MLHVLYALGTGKGGLRFSEIKKSSLTDSTTLARRLAELEEIGIVVRNDLSTTQLNVEYHFTDLFEMLKPILIYISNFLTKKFYPFFLLMTIIFLLIFVLSIIILITIIKKL